MNILSLYFAYYQYLLIITKVNNEFGLYDTFNIIRKDNKKFKPPIFGDGQDIVILS